MIIHTEIYSIVLLIVMKALGYMISLFACCGIHSDHGPYPWIVVRSDKIIDLGCIFQVCAVGFGTPRRQRPFGYLPSGIQRYHIF